MYCASKYKYIDLFVFNRNLCNERLQNKLFKINPINFYFLYYCTVKTSDDDADVDHDKNNILVNFDQKLLNNLYI